MFRIDQDAIAVEDHQLEGDLHPRSLAALDGTANISDVETEHLEQRRTVADLLDEARTALDRLTPDEASSALERGAVLVDTRCQDQRLAAGIIPGSIHVPLSVLPWRADPSSDHGDDRLADLDAVMILLCAHGYSSSLAAVTLRQLGFHRATDVVGGFEAWAAAGLPVKALVSAEDASPSS
jgi:rhodanese-related sulfurtransferase